MRGQSHRQLTREKAEQLRLIGKSYKEIGESLKIPKSTLATWLGNKYPNSFNKKAQLIHLAKIRPLAATAKLKKQEDEKNTLAKKVREEIITIPLGNNSACKTMLAMLYWAEGAKYPGVSGLKFTNTDPLLAKLYVSLLRKCFTLQEHLFRVTLHLHYYHKIKICKEFWSKQLAVPTEQFNSVFIKKRSRKRRFRKNFMGICFINYLDSSIRKELMEFARQIAANYQ